MVNMIKNNFHHILGVIFVIVVLSFLWSQIQEQDNRKKKLIKNIMFIQIEKAYWEGQKDYITKGKGIDIHNNCWKYSPWNNINAKIYTKKLCN